MRVKAKKTDLRTSISVVSGLADTNLGVIALLYIYNNKKDKEYNIYIEQIGYFLSSLKLREKFNITALSTLCLFYIDKSLLTYFKSYGTIQELLFWSLKRACPPGQCLAIFLDSNYVR